MSITSALAIVSSSFHRSGENNIREVYINTMQRSKISESLAHYIVVRLIRKKGPGPASNRIQAKFVEI